MSCSNEGRAASREQDFVTRRPITSKHRTSFRRKRPRMRAALRDETGVHPRESGRW
jgi:hypothetical protein